MHVGIFILIFLFKINKKYFKFKRQKLFNIQFKILKSKLTFKIFAKKYLA